MHEKPFQINSWEHVQTRQNDLKSAVSEHAKNNGPVQKLLAWKTTCFHTRYTRPYKFRSSDQKLTVIRATTFPSLMEQFCSLIKTNSKGHHWWRNPKSSQSSAKLSMNYCCWQNFFSVIKCPNSRITLSSSMFSYVWITVSIKNGLWTADHGLRTTDCGLDIKNRLGIKCGLWATLVKTVLLGSRWGKIRSKDR